MGLLNFTYFCFSLACMASTKQELKSRKRAVRAFVWPQDLPHVDLASFLDVPEKKLQRNPQFPEGARRLNQLATAMTALTEGGHKVTKDCHTNHSLCNMNSEFVHEMFSKIASGYSHSVIGFLLLAMYVLTLALRIAQKGIVYHRSG